MGLRGMPVEWLVDHGASLSDTFKLRDAGITEVDTILRMPRRKLELIRGKGVAPNITEREHLGHATGPLVLPPHLAVISGASIEVLTLLTRAFTEELRA
eukprot:6077795-Prymnesium_polylepis.1